MIGLVVQLLVRAILRSSKKSSRALGPPAGNQMPHAVMRPYHERGNRVTRDGVGMQVGIVAPAQGQRWFFAHISAPARGPRFVRSYDWGAPHVPARAYPLLQMPSIGEDTRGDALARSALPALDAAWRTLIAAGARIVIVCDGVEVVAWLDEPPSPEVVETTIGLVAAIARWDAPLAVALAALPDATLLADPVLSPAVSLAPDGLRVGVRDGALVAELGGESQAIDRGRLAAEIAAIRVRRSATAPYR